LAQASNGGVLDVQVATSEEALSELGDASGRPDWIAALVAGKDVFQAPGEMRFAIIDRKVFGWSLDHPRHAGVALKVRVLDGEYAGRTGYVLASRLKFLDQTARREEEAAPNGKQAGGSARARGWTASCYRDHASPRDPAGELSWPSPRRTTRAEAQKDADFHNSLWGHHAEVDPEIKFDWGSVKASPEPGDQSDGWNWTALCVADHQNAQRREPGTLTWSSRPRRATRAEAQKDADDHNKLTGHHAAVYGAQK